MPDPEPQIDAVRNEKTTEGERDRLSSIITDEVARQLANERALIANFAGIALRMVGAALTLSVALLTALGWTTWKDIKATVAEHVQQRVDNLLEREDTETSVKHTLTDLINRATLASATTAIRNIDPERLSEFVLQPAEWSRLRDWLKDEDLPVQEFRDVLTVLNTQPPERKSRDANSLLSELLNPPSASPYAWMLKQPEKRYALLENFIDPDMGTAALAVAQTKHISLQLRTAAFDYIRRVHVEEGFDALWTIATTAGDSLSRQALVTCATLQPIDSRVLEAITNLREAKPTADNAMTALAIVRNQWDPREGGWRQTGDDEDTTAGVGADLLAYTLRADTTFAIDFNYTTRERSLVLKALLSRERGHSSSYNLIDVRQLPDFKPYWTLLARLAEAGQTRELHMSVPIDANGELSIHARATGETELVVATSNGESRIEPREAWLIRTNIEEPVQIIWACGDRDCDGELISMKGEYTFELDDGFEPPFRGDSDSAPSPHSRPFIDAHR